MNLLDGLLFYAAGAGSLYAVQHFWPKGKIVLPDAAKVETTLSGFGQILTHGEQSVLTFLTSMEQRIMSAIEDKLSALVAKATAAGAAAAVADEPAKIAAAKAEQEAADIAAVDTAAAAIPDVPALNG